MRRVWWLVPACAVTLIPGRLAARQAQDTQGGAGVASAVSVEVIARAVSPATIEMGDEALERLVATAPEGITLEVADRDVTSGPDSPERLGAWRSSRSPTDQGEVVWTFTAPLTAWTAGAHRTPPLAVIVRQGGQVRQTLHEGPLPFRVESPVPAGARVLRPTPPMLPEQQPPTWPGLLAVLPALAAVGSGFAWLRGRGEPGAPVAGEAPVRAAPPAALEAIMGRVDSDPLGAVLEAADAVRRHPRLITAGVREAHTTGDVLLKLRGSDDLAGVAALLALADAAKYAGHCPTAQETVDVVAPMLEAFGRG